MASPDSVDLTNGFHGAHNNLRGWLGPPLCSFKSALARFSSAREIPRSAVIFDVVPGVCRELALPFKAARYGILIASPAGHKLFNLNAPKVCGV
jgi:hypothetical protein